MRKLAEWLLAVGMVALFSLSALGERGEPPWRPSMNSPVNFYQIQVDKQTPAQETTAPIYAEVQEKYPEAADNARHAAISR